jgi:protein-L-isoaspartate(D-aspartate) O-methyltransferase
VEDSDGPACAIERAHLVELLRAEGSFDAAVLRALGEVPRHEFVPLEQRPHAYDNRPLPIGHLQTISQPHIVALMTQLAQIEPGHRVLEIGTGSGYQTAVLAALGAEVFTIEIVAALAERARVALERLGYAERVQFFVGDGWAGLEGAAPFAAILVTAAPPVLPQALKAQLELGGRLVCPVGEERQELRVVVRTTSGFPERAVAPVVFVPMTGEAEGQTVVGRARTLGAAPAPSEGNQPALTRLDR